jgi:hypothetical protein
MAPFLHSRGGAFSDCKTLKSSLHPEKWTLLTGWSVLIEIIVTFCFSTLRFEFLCFMLVVVLSHVKGLLFYDK